jgi:exodeoxyribonuclease VIII
VTNPATSIRPAGVYYDLPDGEYRADYGIAQSDLKRLGRSPKFYRAGVEDDEEREESDALTLGKIVGQIAMEPEKPAWWIVRPEGLDARTKDGKAWLASVPAGVEPISASLWSKATHIATALLDHPIAGDIVRNSRREVSVFDDYHTERGIIRRKGRLDLVTSGNCLADIKTTVDARPDVFLRSIWKFGYDIQAHSYRDIWNAQNPGDIKDNFLLIAIEKAPPFDLMVHQLDWSILEEGRIKYERLITTYAECVKTNTWPGYPVEINRLSK